MNTRFADAFFYIAFLDKRDASHGKVRLWAQCHYEVLVTTRWVLVELADALSAPSSRVTVNAFLSDLLKDPNTIIVEPSDRLFDAGFVLYGSRPDKAWSLTDCISFAVMEDRGITEALTGDRHFVQAGFKATFAT